MKIFVGYDHRGEAKAYKLIEELIEMGHDVNVPFEKQEETVDYPDISRKVCEQVKKNKENRGLLICGTGIGMCMAANKEEKIRAVLAQTEADAYFARRHEDANVLVLFAGYKDDKFEVKNCNQKAKRIVNVFLTTDFEAGRHVKRVKKLNEINKKD